MYVRVSNAAQDVTTMYFTCWLVCRTASEPDSRLVVVKTPSALVATCQTPCHATESTWLRVYHACAIAFQY